MSRARVVAALALAVTACSDPELVCVEVDLTCAPLYAPTWDNVATNTIVPKCGTGNGVCHSATGRKGGLDLHDATTAYTHLQRYVTPGDVACSELTMRIFSTEPSLVMPRGAPLRAAEQCAIAQWIAAGAPGPVSAKEAP